MTSRHSSVSDDTEWVWSDAVALLRHLRCGDLVPSELLAGTLERACHLNTKLNCINNFFEERAYRTLEQRPDDGRLSGLPILVKDLSCFVRGEPYSAGTTLLKEAGYRAVASSYFVEALEAAGAVIFGNTNTPELGSAPATESEAFGTCNNPHNLEVTAGGSSGGSAAAVAAGLTAIAFGSDGAGSIRMPAAACGVFGFKPTRGLISDGPQAGLLRAGLSTAGVIARSPPDIALAMDIVAGSQPGDPIWVPKPTPGFEAQIVKPPQQLRIGLMTQAPQGPWQLDEVVFEAVAEAATALTNLGHRVSEGWPEALDESAEAARRFVDFNCVNAAAGQIQLEALAGRPLSEGDLEPRNEAFAERGRVLPASAQPQALNWLYGFARRLSTWWASGYDVLVTPVVGQPPWPHGQFREDPDVIRSGEWPYLTMPFSWQFNVTGQPALAVPIGRTSDGRPLGIQMVAAMGADATLLSLAHALWLQGAATCQRPVITH